MVRLADPEARLAVPRTVVPSENVIVPEGRPAPELGATFVVNTTGLPSMGAVGETERVVVVAINAGGFFSPLPVPPPLQPTVIRSELQKIIESARR